MKACKERPVSKTLYRIVTGLCFLFLFCVLPAAGFATGTYTISVGERQTVYWSAPYATNLSQVVWLVQGPAKKISSNLYSCTVEGTGAGTAQVSAYIYYYIQSGSYTYAMSATDAFTIYVKDLQPSSVSLNYSSCSLRIGNVLSLTPTISPSDATTSYTWSSSNTGVATVSTSGTITAKGIGTATITVKTSNGKTATCLVTVHEPLTTVSSSSPANNGVNVLLEAALTVNFSASISAYEQYNAIQLVCLNDQSVVPVEKTISVNALVCTPTVALTPATKYELRIPASALQNNYGVVNTTDSAIQFTTVVFTSVTANLAESQENVPTKGSITVAFNGALQKGTAFDNIKLATGSAQATILTSISGNTLTVTPSIELDDLAYYTLTVPANALTNNDGVSYAKAFTLHFTTALAEGTFEGGTGTENDPYLIGNEDQLSRVADLSDKCFKLINDIRLSTGWKAISSFSGTFDGDHYSLSNYWAASQYIGGIFVTLSDATVKNLNIQTNSVMRYVYSGSLGKQGILAENAINSTIRSCVVSGIAFPMSVKYFGSLIGYTSNCIVSNCSVYLDVTINHGSADTTSGGLIGYSYMTIIDNCYCSGTITATDANASSFSSDTDLSCGGLVGYADSGSISHSRANINMNVNKTQSYPLKQVYVGGLIGIGNNVDLSFCACTGSLDLHFAPGSASLASGHIVRVGGLVGNGAYMDIQDCKTYCTIDAYSSYYSSVSSLVGGLIGYASSSSLFRCLSYNDVLGVAISRSSSQYATGYVGGLVGYTSSSTQILDCYSNADVRDRMIALSKGYYADGSAGTLVGCADNTISVRNCYSMGRAYLCYNGSASGGDDYLYNSFIYSKQVNVVSTEHCYMLYGSSTDYYATLLTADQMHQTASYEGWDFSNVWGIDLNQNNGFPTLAPAVKGVTAAGYAGTFDNLPHTITVTAPSGAMVEYSVDGEIFSENNPAYTATVVPQTVYYRVSLNGESILGFTTISIQPVITGLSMTNTTLNVGVGINYQLSVTLTSTTPELAGVIWKSSNADILTLDESGWLIAKAEGTVKVTCTAWDGSGLSSSRMVNVHAKTALQASPYITSIGARTFQGCEFDEINLDICSELTTIGNLAFADCTNLNDVYIGVSVTSIADDAFTNCPLLCLHCYPSSSAQQYADEHGIRYQLVQPEQ